MGNAKESLRERQGEFFQRSIKYQGGKERFNASKELREKIKNGQKPNKINKNSLLKHVSKA